MKKIIIMLLSPVWILNGNAMEPNHSPTRVPPLNFDKMKRSPLCVYSVFCQEERELYNYCDDGYEKYSDFHKEVLDNFVELLNEFLRLKNPLIIRGWARAMIKDYLDIARDKIQKIQLHKDLLATLEDKASTDVAKKVFNWLKNDTMTNGLYQIIGLTQR